MWGSTLCKTFSKWDFSISKICKFGVKLKIPREIGEFLIFILQLEL